MADEFHRRLPAVERTVAGITPEDIRVRLWGTIVDLEEGRFMLDDGTGRILVGYDQPSGLRPNQFVRVFGRVIPVETGFEIQGEVVQDAGTADRTLLQRVRAMELQQTPPGPEA